MLYGVGGFGRAGNLPMSTGSHTLTTGVRAKSALGGEVRNWEVACSHQQVEAQGRWPSLLYLLQVLTGRVEGWRAKAGCKEG